MNGYKSIFTSVTFWGTVLAAFSTLFPTIYAKLGITDQAAVASQIVAVVSHIISGISYVIIVYGRFRATKHVTLTGNPPAVPSKT
jgi:fumarate reductase subunit D